VVEGEIWGEKWRETLSRQRQRVTSGVPSGAGKIVVWLVVAAMTETQ